MSEKKREGSTWRKSLSSLSHFLHFHLSHSFSDQYLKALLPLDPHLHLKKPIKLQILIFFSNLCPALIRNLKKSTRGTEEGGGGGGRGGGGGGKLTVASVSATMNEDTEEELKPQTPPTKKRKVVEKTVVRVRIGAEFGKAKNEGPPSDSWSWRKYGQKPIKGSPYPRGYYRCSTAKGCSAKKQVERCKSDASVLVVTYTSSHNHPQGIRSVPRIPKQTRQQQRSLESGEDPQEQEEEQSAEDQEAQPTMEAEEFHYSKDLHEGELFTMSQLDTTVNNGSLGLVFLEQESVHVLPTESGSNNSSSELIPPMKPTEAEVEEDEYYDFFDELEELHPTISLLSYGFQEHHQLVG